MPTETTGPMFPLKLRRTADDELLVLDQQNVIWCRLHASDAGELICEIVLAALYEYYGEPLTGFPRWEMYLN